MLLLRARIREQVARERMQALVHVVSRGVQRVSSHQRQHGPNEFFCITRTSLEEAFHTVSGSMRSCPSTANSRGNCVTKQLYLVGQGQTALAPSIRRAAVAAQPWQVQHGDTAKFNTQQARLFQLMQRFVGALARQGGQMTDLFLT